jgi:hypothetical protein
MTYSIRKLIDAGNYQGLAEALSTKPDLANEGIPYDEVNTTKAHPLHRICDGVFANRYSNEAAVKMAKIFLDHGADVNGNSQKEMQDTPLTAAASLRADDLAILYIEHGADIHHRGCHGGTALHWAAWCGRDKLVERLVAEGAKIDLRCIDFKATPLFWAVHGLKNGGKENQHNQITCAKIILQSGADKKIPNKDGYTVFDLLGDGDVELRELLS